MALDERYVVSSDIEQYYVNKDDGLPLSNGKVQFFRDSARTVPKEVFQLSGSPPNYTYTSMGVEITLSAVGTVQNSGGDNEVIYYFPYDSEGELDLYFIRVFDEGGIEQFTREAWPNVTNANDPTKNQMGLNNQISNPTFTNVFINEGKTTVFTVTSGVNQVFELAPNWDFVISGTGTVTVQRIAITGNDKVPTSPPYVLDVLTSVGITTCYLRQRFPYNSGLWASTVNDNIFLAGSLLVRNEVLGTTGIQMLYSPSSGGTPIVIVDGTFQSNYQVLSGSTEDPIPASNDVNSGVDGYIDIYLSFTPSSHVRVSSIQVVPTQGESIDLVHFDMDSSNRNEAFQGDYYIPRNNSKRISSLLTGWDFTVNPFQFGLGGNLSTSAAYIVDQTIAARGSTGNVAWSENVSTHGLSFGTAGANDAFYILTYLTGEQVKEIVGSRLSVNVYAYKLIPGDNVSMRIYLYRGTLASLVPVLPATIGTLAADGTFTLTAPNWTLIPRSGLDTPQVNLSSIADSAGVDDGKNDYGFTGWEITDAVQLSDTEKLAVVVTFHYPDAGTSIIINSISVTPGDIPTRPALQTVDQALRECQYYYEKRYAPILAPGTITPAGDIIHNVPLLLDSGSDGVYAKTFSLIFKSVKRTVPAMTFYAPTSSTPGLFFVYVGRAGGPINPVLATFATFWVVANQGFQSIVIVGISLVAITSIAYDPANQGYYEFHYVADARLGIV